MCRLKASLLWTVTAIALGTRLAGGELRVELKDLDRRADWISFALPVATGQLADSTTVRLFVEGSNRPLPDVRAQPILFRNEAGTRGKEVRSWLIQVPRATVGAVRQLRVTWGPGSPVPGGERVSYSAHRHESAEAVEVVDYAVEKRANGFILAQSTPMQRLLFTGWEPSAIAILPPGYLASTGLFGDLWSSDQLERSAQLRGLGFFTSYVRRFALGALYDEGYRPSAYSGKPGDPATAVVPDLTRVYEAWLYDRCATYLIAYAHTPELRFYRHALRACSFYASTIDERGFSTIKKDARGQATDPKYSHVRGLFLYYAMTGDESALEAGRRVARMWLNEASFVQPYRQGRARGPEKLWTERLLGLSLESLAYGYMLTGDASFLMGARELFDSAWKHLTATDSMQIKAITGHAFTPQPCFVHSSGQHEGWPPAEPYCSPWMSALLVDPLLRYQELTGDARVDEVFIRLAQYLRDTGTTYFYRDPLRDTFFEPRRCYAPAAPGQPVRTLIPLYGAGRRADGSRYIVSEWDDFDHCADATALSAAALRALRRTGGFDRPGPSPFKTQGDSFVALHHELSHCALVAFGYFSRTKRDPRNWKGAELAKGLGDPAFIIKNKIGWPSHAPAPLRKLSWWFNGSLQQFQLLEEASVSVDTLRPGAIQPASCQ